MAKHQPFCKKCHHAVDDQDLRVVGAHLSALGELWVILICGWCGHQWQRLAKGCNRLPGYKAAVDLAYEKQKTNGISVIHMKM